MIPGSRSRFVDLNLDFLPSRFYETDEERLGEFPFKRGRRFTIGISLTRESSSFWVNGKFFAHFNHRTDVDQLAVIKCSAIDGAELAITRFDYFDDACLNLGKLTGLPEESASVGTKPVNSKRLHQEE